MKQSRHPMIGHPPIARAWAAYLGGLALLLLVTSCAPQIIATPAPPTPTATGDVTVTPPPPPTGGTPSPAALPASRPGAIVRLTLWTVEAVSPQAEGEAGQAFATGLSAFEETYRDVSVAVVIKNESGKGSVLDYLRTASQAAPTVLPDLVVLNTADLAQAARIGVLVPLDDLVSPFLADDLLPAARAAGTVEGQLMGIPFELDVEHLIYNTNKIESPPKRWSEVLEADTNYLFPAKGKNGLVNDAFLIQYLALGGRLQDEEGRPALDEQVLRSVLDYYRQALEAEVISSEVLDIATTDDLWPAYVSAQVGMAHVNTHRFLNDRDMLRTTRFADIPTREGTPLTIARGRALAIVTRDPARQAMALRFIEWLMAPDNNATWNQTTAHIPTRYTALSLLGDRDPYWPFLQHQLEIAVPPPAFPGYDQIGRVLQQAVVEVLNGEATPEEAAAAAVDAITP